VRPGLTIEQVAGLSDHSCRHQQIPTGQVQGDEQVDAAAVVFIVRQRGSNRGAGVTDDHDLRPKPSPSTPRNALRVSRRDALPAPNHAGGHDRDCTGRNGAARRPVCGLLG